MSGDDRHEDPRCCWCGGPNVDPVSAFGPTLMTELYRCRDCQQDFEVVRWRTSRR
jgi:hypothetical protein